MSIWPDIGAHIAQTTGTRFDVQRQVNLGGGCINSACRIEGDGQRYFVKLNAARLLDMFEAEALGLREIAAARAVQVPLPICWGASGDSAYLVMDYLELGGGGAGTLAQFGRELAQMHRHAQSRYGWVRDNTIGSTPQPNEPMADWIAFWRERRLGFQLELAARNGCPGSLRRKGERLLERVDAFFDGYRPPASLLHGDLWSGNYSADAQGRPVIFDPAVYFGDREADLAMTELFGGFGPAFYRAYEEAYPMDQGYRVRKTLYNLYHVLNHFNLFGGGYAAQAERMTDALLAETGA